MHNNGLEGEHKISSLQSSIVGQDNCLDSAVEELVATPKVAVEVLGERRKHHVPSEFVLRVKVTSQHLKRLKVTATRAGGQWFITLVTERGEILRQYHFQYGSHENPDGTVVGRSHKHFPTEKYPLQEGHKGIETWAYDPGAYPDDFVEAVKEFCKECNIAIAALQERLSLRWFQ